MPVSPNIITIPLFSRLTLTTVGTSLTKSSLDLNTPQLRTLLPQASGIFLIGLTEAVPASDFEWMVAFYSGFDRDHQPATPQDIATTTMTSAAPEGQRSVEYPTVSKFLLESRLQLWWRNPSGVNVVRTGIVSAVLGLRMST